MHGIRHIIISAFLAAVLCVLGPLSLPVGPIPVSLATLWICLAAGLQGRRGIFCVLVYLLLGAVGLPVFSCFTGGVGVLLAPTGGYLMGYVFLACCTGIGAGRGLKSLLAGMLAGTALLYALGSWWFCFQTGIGFLQAAAICVVPFLPFDVMKIVAALLLLPRISQSLKKTGFI